MNMKKMIITSKQYQEVMYVYEVDDEHVDTALDIVNKFNNAFEDQDDTASEDLKVNLVDKLGKLKSTRVVNMKQTIDSINIMDNNDENYKISKLIEFSPKYFKYLTKALDNTQDYPELAHGEYIKLMQLNPHILYGIVKDFIAQVDEGKESFNPSYIERIEETIQRVYHVIKDTKI